MAGTIWWDFDGTLVNRPRMWSEAGYRLMTGLKPKHGFTQDQVADQLRTRFPWHQGSSSAHPELATPELWWSAIYNVYSDALRHLGFDDADIAGALPAIRGDILDASRYRLFDDVEPVLNILSNRDWRQIIVSNHVPELGQIISDLGIGRYFSAVVTSGSVGYEKPHNRMFEVATEHSVPNARTWMVGDNVACDCLPVAAFGVDAVLGASRVAAVPAKCARPVGCFAPDRAWSRTQRNRVPSFHVRRVGERSAGGGEPRELPLQHVDLCQVAAGIVIAASLAASEPKPAARVCVAGAASAQVDNCREVLTLLQRGSGNAVISESARDRAIQQRCGHFHRVPGHHARVEPVEPARPRVVPGAVLDHDVVMDAVAPGFREGAVGDLKHADGARGRPVHFEWVPTEPPPPIGACHWVAAALHLGQ